MWQTAAGLVSRSGHATTVPGCVWWGVLQATSRCDEITEKMGLSVPFPVHLSIECKTKQKTTDWRIMTALNRSHDIRLIATNWFVKWIGRKKATTTTTNSRQHSRTNRIQWLRQKSLGNWNSTVHCNFHVDFPVFHGRWGATCVSDEKWKGMRCSSRMLWHFVDSLRFAVR